MKSRFLRACLPFCLLCLTFSGCSFWKGKLGTQAVSFNLAVEKAQNEMLLLNVIRAKDRMPMYLTSVSRVSGSVTLGATVGGSSQVVRKTPEQDSWTYGPLTPGASYSTNPSFDIAILDTQEFMRGFLAPIPKETFAYFWDQGWPPEVLLYFLVQRIEIANTKCPQEPPTVYKNYPEVKADQKKGDLEKFGEYVQRFLAQKPRIETRPAPKAIGPLIPAGDVADLEQLVSVTKEGLVLEEVKDSRGFRMGYQLQRPAVDILFTLTEPTKKEEGKEDQDLPKCTSGQGAAPAPEEGTPKPRQESEMRVAEEAGKETTFVLRSPEGLLYYLGQIARLENPLDERPRKIPLVCAQGRMQPLFSAYPPSDCEKGILSVGSGDERFLIPEGTVEKSDCADGALKLEDKPVCKTGRSMQALRLLSQLMALQKSGKELPGTAAVRLIGGP